MTLARLGLLSLLALTGCKREPIAMTKDAGLSQRRQDALARATPANVSMSMDAGTIHGRARNFDEVAVSMRELNNIVWTSKGWGRVVERQRGGSFRVQLDPRWPLHFGLLVTR